jgi:hypothetical protein
MKEEEGRILTLKEAFLLKEMAIEEIVWEF